MIAARHLSLITRRRFFRLKAMQEQHLALMERTLGYLHPILPRSQIATLTLYGIADALMVDETTITVGYLLKQATDYGATNCTETT